MASVHKIFKYPLQVNHREMIQMPKGARPLDVIVQGGIPNLYALVDPLQSHEPRIFRTVCAGEEFNASDMVYVASFSIDDWFVGHTFEQVGPSPDPISERYAGDFKELLDTLFQREKKPQQPFYREPVPA